MKLTCGIAQTPVSVGEHTPGLWNAFSVTRRWAFAPMWPLVQPSDLSPKTRTQGRFSCEHELVLLGMFTIHRLFLP